ASYNGNIVVGGEFTVGTAPGNYIARWNGVSWDTMNGGITAGVNPRAIESLYVHDGELHAGGRFSAMGGVNANKTAVWSDCGGGPVGEVVGTVRDRATGEPLEFASVTLVDGPSVQWGPGGAFEFLDVPAGAWTIRAEAMEYYPRSRAIEVVEASRTIVHSLLQKAEPGTEPAVISVTSPVCGPEQRAYFLDGIAVSQTFEATVD